MFSILYHREATGAENAYDVLVDVEKGGSESALQKAITFYQRYISPHDDARCLYYPTCSQFYKIALNKYGFLWGSLMVIDRLFYRENEFSMKYYIFLQDKNSHFDPVYHNYIFNKDDYYR